MSQSRRPPQQVFIVRRILVLAVLIAIIALIVWVFDEPESTTPDSTASSVPPVVQTITIGAPIEKCKAEDIWLRPVVPAGQPAGKQLQIDLAISTRSEKSCTLELRKTQIIGFVIKGETKQWSTEKCPTALIDGAIVVAPGWVTTRTVVWSCGNKLGTGEHTLQLATYGGEPGKDSFTLKAPVVQEPSSETSPN